MTDSLCEHQCARLQFESAILLPSGPDAMAVVDAKGVRLASNDRFDGLFPDIFVQRNGRISLRHDQANQRFVALLANITTSQQVRIGVPAMGGRRPHVVRLERVALSCELRLLNVIDLSPRPGPGLTLLQELFGLTNSEAKVAQAVSEALPLQAFAETQSLSLQTVRSQLKAVFAKTGVRRQVELAVLIARLAG